jgi:hypothetical protein
MSYESLSIKFTYLNLKLLLYSKLEADHFLVNPISEVNAGFFYRNAEQREQMVAAERRSVDERVQKIIDLKKKVTDLFRNPDSVWLDYILVLT